MINCRDHDASHAQVPTTADLVVPTLRESGVTEMTAKGLVRPIPGARRISLLRQRLDFTSSAAFWERRYAKGGTSGPGSYGDLARGKAAFLNAFVRDRDVRTVIEFGCGDGHQLSLADYPNYVGLDVSPSAISLCKNRFASDGTKSFFLYEGCCCVGFSETLSQVIWPCRWMSSTTLSKTRFIIPT